jgi:hypothetical protein
VPLVRVRAPAVEVAETLALPPGMHGQVVPLDALPKTVTDARVQFTLLSRELGKEYRIKYGVELRTDIPSLQRMQKHLLDALPDGKIRTSGQAHEVRRHGAFLSEVLARNLGAEWVDVGPSELGYWAMIVPPKTRVWPFARIVRLIAMGDADRDLVNYYAELEHRTHPK